VRIEASWVGVSPEFNADLMFFAPQDVAWARCLPGVEKKIEGLGDA